MVVDSQAALRGVRARLIGAVAAASVTLVCLLYAVLSSLSSFGVTFALTVGLCSFGAAVALLLSARHEEEVHELATELGARRSAHPQEEAAGRRALPEPNPLASATLGDRPEFDGVRREVYSAKTDGAI